MVNKYVIDVDWKEVSDTDQVVISYENIKAERNDVQKRGRKQKHYIVRGRALKLMLMRANKADEVREHFLKVEDPWRLVIGDFASAS